MNCNDFKDIIDLFIDGEITSEQESAMRAHVAECRSCAEEFSAALAIREAMTGMDDNMTVPLQTQAAWRRAVRNEAAKKKNRTIQRVVYAAAAVLVLAFGCTAVLKNDSLFHSKSMSNEAGSAILSEETAVESVVIGSDGVTARSATTAYAAERKYESVDYTNAVETLRELVAEYEAVADIDESTASDGKHTCDSTISISSANAEDFLNSISHLGTETVHVTGDLTAETVTVHITIQEI